MQEFGSDWEWLPKTLVDWAQILSAIGTCGAVIVSLILAGRRPKPVLLVQVNRQMLVTKDVAAHGKQFVCISIVNAGASPAIIEAIYWMVARRWWRGVEQGFAYQSVATTDWDLPNPTLPAALQPGQRVDVRLPLGDESALLADIRDGHLFGERLVSRTDVNRLRVQVHTSVGVIASVRPDDSVLDLVWRESPPGQKAR